MRPALAVLALSLFLTAPSFAQKVTEPKTGESFDNTDKDGWWLLGTGVRTRTLLNVKVYAIGLYVDGPSYTRLVASKGGNVRPTPELYKELVWGDFGKRLELRFVRDLSASQIQGAFREALPAADKARVDEFVGFFGDITKGQQAVIRWAPGGTLETTVAGTAKPPIANKEFAAAVFSIWLGEKPIQSDIKQGLVGRAAVLVN
ncbi:MAG: chalcone isomerase family protein [Vicinamibacteria bacterium]